MNTQDLIERRLDSSTDIVRMSLLALYERERQEKRALPAMRTPGLSFNEQDGPFLRELASRLSLNGKASDRELRIARNKLKRHLKALELCSTTVAPPAMTFGEAQQLADFKSDFGAW